MEKKVINENLRIKKQKKNRQKPCFPGRKRSLQTSWGTVGTSQQRVQSLRRPTTCGGSQGSARVGSHPQTSSPSSCCRASLAQTLTRMTSSLPSPVVMVHGGDGDNDCG